MRGSRLSMLAGIGILAAGIAAAAMPAAAETITYTNFEVANDVNVSLTCAPGLCTSGHYGSGQIDLYDNGPEVAQVWCVDVTHDLLGPWSTNAGGTSYAFDVTAWQDQGGGLSNIWSGGGVGFGQQLTNAVVGEIGGLAKYGDLHSSQFQNGGSVSSAIQLAIWDVEYNGGATKLDGALNPLIEKSDSANTQSLAEAFVAAVENGTIASDLNVDWLTNCTMGQQRPCNQAQFEVRDVPEPMSLVLFGSGLLAAGWFGRRSLRRRARRPA